MSTHIFSSNWILLRSKGCIDPFFCIKIIVQKFGIILVKLIFIYINMIKLRGNSKYKWGKCLMCKSGQLFHFICHHFLHKWIMHYIKLPFKIAIFWNRVQTIFDFPRRLQKNVYIAKELVCGGNKIIGKLFHNSYIKLDKISNFSLRCIISFKIGTT